MFEYSSLDLLKSEIRLVRFVESPSDDTSKA